SSVGGRYLEGAPRQNCVTNAPLPNLHCALFSVGRRLKEDRDDLAGRPTSMRSNSLCVGALTSFVLTTLASMPAVAQQQQQQQQQKPNILFIMGDDIGWMQPSIYHQGLMVGETPNIDRIGQEGAKFTDYYAEQSCTAGRNAFFTGMHPLRTGMIP